MKIEEMKRIAEARTNGPWQYSCCYGVATIECEKNNPIAHAVEYIKTRDADFICLAANTYDKLLAVAEAAKEVSRTKSCDYENEKCDCGLVALEQALEALEQE